MPDRPIDEQLVKYLTDAHSIEEQALAQMRAAPDLAGDPQLAALFEEHLEETREHQRLVETLLETHGGSPNAIKDAAMRLGALNWGGFFAAQPDTPAKLAAVAYAFENFEIASYELLKRVAERAGDTDTVEMAEKILINERQAVEKLAASYDLALERAVYGSQRA